MTAGHTITQPGPWHMAHLQWYEHSARRRTCAMRRATSPNLSLTTANNSPQPSDVQPITDEVDELDRCAAETVRHGISQA